MIVFNHCFVVLKNVEDRTESRRLPVRRNIINITQFKSVVLDWSLGFGCACLMGCHATGSPVLFLWISSIGLRKNGTLQYPNPKDQELEPHPCVNLHQEKLFQHLSNCVRQKFAFCTSNLLEQTCDFQICARVHLMLILSLQDLRQSPSLNCCAVFPT